MSSRVGFALAVLLLLVAAALRFWNLSTLPPGLNAGEIIDVRIVESVRLGRIEVFYDLSTLGATGGREGLYHVLLAVSSFFTGSGLLGYRVLSVFTSLLTLALVYAAGMRLYGSLAGVAAMALLALGMYPILLGREVGRETLLPLLTAAVLLGLVKALPIYKNRGQPEPGTLTFAALGLVLGLGFYIHPDNFLITLLSMLFIAYMVVSSHRLSRRTTSYISFSILLMIILAVPYVLSTIRLPDLEGTGRVFDGYTIDQLPPLQAVWNGIRGLFFVGDMNPERNLPARPMFDLVSGLFILLGLLTALRSAGKPRYLLLIMAVCILSPIAFFSSTSPDFERYASLLPVLALLFGLGVAALYQGLAATSRRVLAVGLGALLVFNIVWTTGDLFTHWPRLPEVGTLYNQRIAQLAHHLDLTADTTSTVVCMPTVFPRAPGRSINDTQLLFLMTHRKTAPLRFADCGTSLIFTQGGERQQIIMPDPHTLANMHPYLREWIDQGDLQTGEHLPSHGVVVLDVTEELAAHIGLFTTTAEVEYGPETNGDQRDLFPPVRFGGNITFLGYEREQATVYNPGSIVTNINYWRVDGPLPPDMRLFTHILSGPANIVAQMDTRSVVPGQLRERDVFVQIIFVTLPATLPEGEYTMSIGAYQDSDRMRMPVLDGDMTRGNRLFLSGSTITVEQPASE